MKRILSENCLDLLVFEELLTENSPSADRACDWSNCSEMGVFDHLKTDVFMAEARRNLVGNSRFVFLCPRHFVLAMAKINDDYDE